MEFPELQPELLDGAQSGVDGLELPVLSLPQGPRGILEGKDADVAHIHAFNIVIPSTIFNGWKRLWRTNNRSGPGVTEPLCL
jgi:hypothetical protein